MNVVSVVVHVAHDEKNAHVTPEHFNTHGIIRLVEKAAELFRHGVQENFRSVYLVPGIRCLERGSIEEYEQWVLFGSVV